MEKSGISRNLTCVVVISTNCTGQLLEVGLMMLMYACESQTCFLTSLASVNNASHVTEEEMWG